MPTIPAASLYKPARSYEEQMAQDLILSLATYLCFEHHRHNASVVCFDCQVEAANELLSLHKIR